MDGVDGILIGPYDLSIGLGMAGQFTRPEFQAAVDRILAACRNAGKMAVMFTGNRDDVGPLIRRGFSNVLFSLDVLALTEAYRSLAESFHEEFCRG